MLTADKAKEIVQAAVDENWTPGQGGQPGHLDLDRFWHSFQRHLIQHLRNDPPAGIAESLHVEGFLAMAGCVLLCRSFWILQAKATWHGSGPHTGWHDLLEWFRTSLDDLLRESRELGLQEKRMAQQAAQVPASISIPTPLKDWRDPL